MEGTGLTICPIHYLLQIILTRLWPRRFHLKMNCGAYVQQVHTQLHPDDTSGVEVWSAMEEAKRYYSLTGNIKFFFWFVGVCTIIAGRSGG